MVINSKSEIRQKLKSLESNKDLNLKIESQVKSWPVYQQAEKVAFYLAMKDEVCLDFIFASGKEVYLPRYKNDSGTYEMAKVTGKQDLCEGKYGIKEPGEKCPVAAKNSISLWFIPGVAFSLKGDRLGRGAGFYDRLLENEQGVKVGICSSERIVEQIPHEKHDIKMDFVLTDKEIIKS